MSNASASVPLLWSILATLFFVFMVHHLWSYDRFNCLKWNSGRQPGAFKRLMTYTYLGSVPLIAFFSIVMTHIKFKEGWTLLPNGTVIPKPVDSYSTPSRHWLLPLYFVFSMAWALELITHLEELTFWLFMVHQGPGKGQWFSSWEYRLWYLGSMVSILGLPLTTLVSRYNIETCDAWIVLVGASGSTSTTLAFLYVLWKFPIFLRHVKSEGADPNVVVQLHTFYHLNRIRFVFRLLFSLPLLVIGIDAVVMGTHPVNANVFWSDLLFMLGGLGCFFSSAMTLLIFFPRSIAREAYEAKIETPPQSTVPVSHPPSPKSPTINLSQLHRYPLPSTLVSEFDLETCASGMRHAREFRDFHSLDMEVGVDSSYPKALLYHQYQVNQPYPTPVLAHPMLGRSISMAPQLRRVPALHPYVATFTSPIDIVDVPPTPPDPRWVS